jgi:AAA+ ATPase superfamily predicted ATPase
MANGQRTSPNPFEYARELGVGELVDRDDEVESVVSTIRNHGKLFLIGPRRYGKTSILRAASEKAARGGMLVLRYNVEAWPSLGEMLQRIVTDAAQLLASTNAKTRGKLRDIFARLEPRFTFDLEGKVSAAIGVKSGTEAGNVPLIVDAFNGIEALAARSKQAVGLILDEFQKIIELGGESAEGQIRAAAQQHRHLGYVFAGSKTRMLTEMTTSPSRPFYRLGERIFLGPVPREQFLAFINRAFKKTGILVEPRASEAILALAEDVPYNVQRLAHASWEYLARSSRPILTDTDVKAALELILRRDDPFYTQLWNPLSPQQKKALIAVIRMGGVNLLSKASLDLSGLPNSTMQQATKALKDKEILRDEEKLGQKGTRFEDPFFAAWIMMVTS